MLSETFQNLLLASRDAGMLALAIGILLLAFGRWIAPAWRHWLWLLVALRLLLPALPSSPTSWQRLLRGEWEVAVSEGSNERKESEFWIVRPVQENTEGDEVVNGMMPVGLPGSYDLSILPENNEGSQPVISQELWQVAIWTWFFGFVTMSTLVAFSLNSTNTPKLMGKRSRKNI